MFLNTKKSRAFLNSIVQSSETSEKSYWDAKSIGYKGSQKSQKQTQPLFTIIDVFKKGNFRSKTIAHSWRLLNLNDPVSFFSTNI